VSGLVYNTGIVRGSRVGCFINLIIEAESKLPLGKEPLLRAERAGIYIFLLIDLYNYYAIFNLGVNLTLQALSSNYLRQQSFLKRVNS
jgi:hypothetical protein